MFTVLDVEMDYVNTLSEEKMINNLKSLRLEKKSLMMTKEDIKKIRWF